MRTIPLLLVKGTAFFFLSAPFPSAAQVVPDTTLPVNSLVRQQGNTSLIEGGTRSGANLFHSFKEFSVLTGNTAFFNNALDVQNIISRVTGGSISNIDGLLKANGTANLFLINPNGIIFGPNARLYIGGSFLGSTASRLNFADGNQFSATAPEAPPLLTVSVPVGLQFGENPGAIQVEGTGQGLAGSYKSTLPIVINPSSKGLAVQPGKTLALVGGNILLNGANLAAEGGQVELSSIGSGSVSLIPVTKGWTLGYESSPKLKDIQISQQSLVDASGFNSGSVSIQGANVTLGGGSIIVIQNQGEQSSGSLKVDASESLVLDGTSPGGKFPSLLLTESVGTGNAADIGVFTKRLLVQGGAGIDSNTFSLAKGGDIIVNALKSIQLLGFSPFNVFLPSNIATATLSTGGAGKITVSTVHLMARDGGEVASLGIGTGPSGDIFVKATDSIELINSRELINSGSDYAPSEIGTTAFKSGNPGNLTLSAPRIVVGTAAVVNTSTVGPGIAGTVNISASQSLDISGAVGSSAIMADASTQELFGSPSVPSGSSGKVKIDSGRVSVEGPGLISVVNEGPGAGGSVSVNARSIFLDNKAGITAATASGKGGNISLKAQNLQLRHNSLITSTAGGSGNGGNIIINTGTLVASENSPITANANQGSGGNIQITAQGIFRSPDSPITASSQLGINGTVQINTLEEDAVRNIGFSPVAPVDLTKLIAQGCPANLGPLHSQLTVIGSGGPPASPNDSQEADTVWADTGNASSAKVSSDQSNIEPTPSTEIEYDKGPIVEAQGMVRGKDGDVVFTADAPTLTPDIPWLRPSSCQTH